MRLTHLRALARLPVRAASGLSSAWQSWRKGSFSSWRSITKGGLSRSGSKGRQEQEAGDAVEEQQQEKEQQQGGQDMLHKAKHMEPAASLDSQCDGEWPWTCMFTSAAC